MFNGKAKKSFNALINYYYEKREIFAYFLERSFLLKEFGSYNLT